MTNKVAFMNENDNDYHLDLQVIFQIKIDLKIYCCFLDINLFKT